MPLRKWKGLFASAVLAVALSVVIDGCSSGSSATNDGDAAAEASHPTRRLDAGSGMGVVDSGGDSSATFDGTTGQPCMTDAECSPSGLGINKCTIAGFFQGGPIFPTPVCMPFVSCNSGTDNFIHYCDGPDVQTSKGVCVPSSTTPGSGTCFPKCTILADGSAATGCQGKDRCQLIAWGLTTTGSPVGIGQCFGGCAADADCPTGSKCQTSDGVCVTAPTTPTKQLGQACSVNDTTGACSCLRRPSTGVGYCTQFCITGPSSPAPCPSGYTCDSSLPAQITNSLTDATVTGFTTQNAGLAGVCLQSCAADGGVAPIADAASDSSGEAAGDSASDAGGSASNDAAGSGGNDAAGSGQVPNGCPLTAACSSQDTAGPVCIP